MLKVNLSSIVRILVFIFFSVGGVYASGPMDFIKSVTDSTVGLFIKGNVPKTVAVMPFTGEGTDDDKKELRITFNNHISSKKFENIKLDEIDEKIAILEKESGKKWSDFDPVTLSKKLGVDGLFYVEVIAIEKVYAGVYGSLTIKVKGKLVSGEKGETIWEKEDSVAERSGGVPLSPWGAISTAVSSAMVLRESVKIALMDKLFREMAKGIPEPKVGVVRKPPVIFSVITNAQDSPFKLGGEILIAMKGQPGCVGNAEIADVSKDIQLSEIEPGNYVGKYIVKDGDNVKGKLIKVSLFDPKSKLESIYTVPHPVELDSIPPAEIKNIKITGLKDKVQLTWERVDDAKDYFIQRSETGEFVDLFITQVPEGYDETAMIGKTYYYRIYARDKAGNPSKPVDVKFYYVKKGPTVLPKNISENFVMYADGSPYIVSENTVIAKGVELTAEPGVVIEIGSGYILNINGKVRLNGDINYPITVKGDKYKINISDGGSDAFMARYVVFENGESLNISNSSAVFENSKVNNFASGIIIERNGLLHSNNLSLISNGYGVSLNNGTLSGSVEFKNNKIAISFNEGDLTKANIKLGENDFYIKANNRLNLKSVELYQSLTKNLEAFIKNIDNNVNIDNIIPLGKSISELRGESVEMLKIAIAKGVISESKDEVIQSLKRFEAVAGSNNISNPEFFAYVYQKYGFPEKGKIFADKTDIKYREILNNYFAKDGSSRFKFQIAEMKYSTIQQADNIEQLLAKRLETKALRDMIDELIPQIDRNKLVEIDKKLLINAGKYVPAIYPFGKIDSEISSSVYFIYAVDQKQIKDDLIAFGIIGSDKKETKIGLVSCNVNFVTDEIRNIIRKHKFEFVDLKYDVCDIFPYYSKAKDQMIDLLVLLKSQSKQLQSKLGSSLNLFSSNIEIRLGNVFLERDYAIITDGGTAYHVNEEDGKNEAFKDALSKIKDKFERNILTFERDLALDDSRIKAKAKYLSEKTQAPVVLTILKDYPIFANQYKSYAEHPILEVAIKNNTKKPLKNVKYSFFIKGLMDFPSEFVAENIDSQQVYVGKIKAVFNNKILDMTENSKYQGEIKAIYVIDGVQNESKAVASLNVYEKNALVWDDKRKLSTFITPRDPNVLDLTRIIANNIANKVGTNNISYGIAVFEFLKTYGVKYQQDPNSPYSSVSNNVEVIDYVQYPSDTLKRKTGDCDDLVALIASLLEGLGVKTAFVDIPGHIFVMFDIGISPLEVDIYGLKKSDFIEYENRLYLPIETTLLKSSFVDSWKQGLNLYNKHYNNNLTITTTDKGWEIYKPPTFEREKISFSLPFNFQSSYNISLQEFKKIRDIEIINYIKTNKIKPENTLYRMFLDGLIEDAIHVSSIIEKQGHKTPQFLNDTGNLYFSIKRYKEALEYYKKAFNLTGNPVYVQNILTTYLKLNDSENYSLWEKKLIGSK